MAKYRAIDAARKLADEQLAVQKEAFGKRQTINITPRTLLPLNLIPGDAPPAPEVLEQAIVDLAAAWKQFTGTRLRRGTLILLLHDVSGVGKTDIKKVLNALDILEGQTLNPPPRRPS